jgi:hypothetical protein
MNSVLSPGQPLAASRDIKDGELKIASQWSYVQHPSTMGYTDSDLGFFLELLLKVKNVIIRYIFL